MKFKKILSGLLLGFVLVSIGFAVGRETAPRGGNQSEDMPGATGAAAGASEGVVVYYLHATFRCATCNQVESTTDKLIRTEFAAPLAQGKLQWKSVNYQENEALAKRYNVGGNLIVVARFSDGLEVEHRRLDRVMELAHEPEELTNYVRGAIRELLEGKS